MEIENKVVLQLLKSYKNIALDFVENVRNRHCMSFQILVENFIRKSIKILKKKKLIKDIRLTEEGEEDTYR